MSARVPEIMPHAVWSSLGDQTQIREGEPLSDIKINSMRACR